MDDKVDIITLMDENGQEIEFEIITKLEIEDNEYFIVSEVGRDEEEAIILKLLDDNEGTLVSVDDDDEYEIVKEAYEALINDEFLN